MFLRHGLVVLALVVCALCEDFTISRNVSNYKDSFTVPPSQCGRQTSETDPCRSFNADPSNVNCLCQCKENAATFGLYNKTWGCTNNNMVRTLSDCKDLVFIHETSENPKIGVYLYYEGDEKKIKSDFYNSNCAPWVASASYRECNETWTNIDPDYYNNVYFYFDPVPPWNRAYQFKFGGGSKHPVSFLAGRVIKIQFYCGQSSYHCLLVKIQGNSTCPATMPTPIPTKLTSTIPSTEAVTSTPLQPSSTTPALKTTLGPSTSPSSTKRISPTNSSNTTSTASAGKPAGGNDAQQSDPEMMPVIAGVISAAAILILTIVATVYYKRRQQRKKQHTKGWTNQHGDGTARDMEIPHDDQNYALPFNRRSNADRSDDLYTEPESVIRNSNAVESIPDDGTLYSEVPDKQPGVEPMYYELEGPYSGSTQESHPTVDDHLYYNAMNGDALDKLNSRGTNQPREHDEKASEEPIYNVLEEPDSTGADDDHPTSIHHDRDDVKPDSSKEQTYESLKHPQSPLYQALGTEAQNKR